SVRFVAITATNGVPTETIRCRFGLSRPEELEQATPDTATGIELTRAFIVRLSGNEDLAVPEIRSPIDLQVLEQISAFIPTLSDGWNVAFGRELNASDDRHRFAPFDRDAPGRPVLEGKQIDAFRAFLEGCRYQLRADTSVRIARRPRLAYRDIASATN